MISCFAWRDNKDKEISRRERKRHGSVVVRCFQRMHNIQGPIEARSLQPRSCLQDLTVFKSPTCTSSSIEDIIAIGVIHTARKTHVRHGCVLERSLSSVSVGQRGVPCIESYLEHTFGSTNQAIVNDVVSVFECLEMIMCFLLSTMLSRQLFRSRIQPRLYFTVQIVAQTNRVSA